MSEQINRHMSRSIGACQMQASGIMPLLWSTLVAILSCRDGYCESRPPDHCPANGEVGHTAGIDTAPRGQQILGPGMGEFIYIQGDQFTMGRNTGECEDQRPEHLVELSSFHIGRTPVTNAHFVRFLNEASVKQDEYAFSQITWAVPSVTFHDGTWIAAQGTEDDAACGQDWELAERYCEWLSAKTGHTCRLPTEAEWEYACRGKEGRKFPWGNDMQDLKNKAWLWRTWRRTKPNAVPVGSFPEGATPEGVCDLVGYMDEMCSDWYDPEYYSKSPRTNPQGPDQPHGDIPMRVTRGGLQHHYCSTGILRFLRNSESFSVLPATFLPRGWSRDSLSPQTEHRRKYIHGRLGFRIVIERADPER